MSIVIGTNGSDVLNGTNQGDIVLGGNGNDVINGQAGNDILDGGNGNDTINGGADNDLITGGNGNDLLDGSSGSDLVLGGNGNDVAVYVAAENIGATDVYLGGNGQDTLRLVFTGAEWTQTNVRADVISYLALLGQANNHNGAFLFSAFNLGVSQFEKLEVFVDGHQINVLLTDPEGDTAVLDLSSATTDQTVISLGNGDTDISTGSGNDSVVAGDGNNSIDTGSGHDEVTTGSGDDVISTGSGADIITIGDGNDVVDAGDDDDVIVAGQGGGDDLIDGGAGIDTVTYPSATSALTIDLRAVDRFATSTSGGSTVGALLQANGYDPHQAVGLATGADIGTDILISIENATGGSGDDTIFDNSLTNVLVGGGGNDTFTVTGNLAGQSDAVDGSAGFDTLIIDYATATNAVLTFDLAGIPNGGGTYSDGADHAVGLGHIERVLITTGSGNDNITTGTGDDVLNGGLGADSLRGGVGNDTYYVDNAGDQVIENAGEGTDTVHATISYTLAPNVEHVTLVEGAGNINATDNALTNILTGNSGDNTFTVTGNLAGQSDAVTGGGGFDTLIIDYSTATNAVLTFDLAGIPAGGGTYSDGADHATGLSGIDRVFITTGSGNDNITTGTGNDSLNGGLGADTMRGSVGNDIYYVDNAGDKVIENAGEGTDTVHATVSHALGANVEHLTLVEGAGNINATDNALTNILTGNSGDNTFTVTGNLAGQSDAVSGGMGFDTLVIDYSTATNAVLTFDLAGIPNGGGTYSDGADHAVGLGHIERVTITTGSGNDNITTGSGNDTIDTGSGNDTLNGGTGADAMAGGAGDDTYHVDNAGDQVIENAGEGTDTVHATVSYTLAPNVEHVTLVEGAGNINATDNALTNILTGNSGDNTFTVTGNLAGQSDAVSGGGGFDTLVIDYATATNAVLTFDLAGIPNGGGTYSDGADHAVGLGHIERVLITTGSGNDNITTGSGNDTIDTGSGNDTLNGGAGNDILIGGTGADALNGGAGTDRASYRTATAAVTASLASPALNTGDAAGDSYVSIENLEGSAFDDTLIGDANNNNLIGGAGADQLDGGGGSDFAGYQTATSAVTASLANPAVNTGDAIGDTYVSIENLRGSDFNDTLTGDGANNFLQGGEGADALNGGAGSDWADYNNATAGLTADLFTPANNTGEAAGDSYTSIENLRGSAFNDILRGNGGNNFLRGGLGADALDGRGGADTADYTAATAGLTIDLGSAANNTGEAAGDTYNSIENLRGSDFNDTLRGNLTVNFLDGADGADVLDSNGDIFDYAWYQSSDSGITANLANSVLNTGDAAGDVYVSIRNLAGSNFNDTLIGDGNGNFLRGQAGADVLNGGLGSDWADYGNAAIGLTADLLMAAVNTGDAAGDSYISIENLQGSGLNDILRGDDNGNLIEGGAGNDTLVGRGGLDLLRGGAGGDVLDGGDGPDWADYILAQAGVTADMGNTANNAGDAAGDTYISIEVLRGSNFNDILRGDGNDNQLVGGLGADQLDGGGGVDTAAYGGVSAGVIADLGNSANNTGEAAGDTYVSIENLSGSAFGDTLVGNAADNVLRGGEGGDALDGGLGSDTADYFVVDGTVGVTADLANAASNTGDAAGDSYVSIENLRGSQWEDVLRGDAGANILTGGTSNDVLEGRGGDDTFVFADTDGQDTIADFVAGAATEDQIDLTGVASVHTFGDVLAHATQDGADTLIDFGGDSIRLLNVTLGNLHQDDFLLA